MDEESREPRRSFGSVGFPFARGYVPRTRRGILLRAGGLASLVLVAYFLADHFFFARRFTSPGPVSSSHASFERKCSLCHDPLGNVSDRKCSICHEKTNDRRGVYTFAAHYVYRSGNYARATVAHAAWGKSEAPCSACHPEHEGRDAARTAVADRQCTTCHQYASFHDGHPEFQFLRDHLPDDSTLVFTHLRHTKFVLDDVKKRTGGVYVEKACLYCHVPMADGRTFQPIDFDAHCSACHLTATSRTVQLPVAASGDTLSAGVQTLESIRKSMGPRAPWAYYQNPNEFALKAGGAKIVKSPVYHRDPWIIENLRMIRSRLYDDVAAADLVRTRGAATADELAAQYREALASLRDQTRGLGARPEPEVQGNLTVIDSLLDVAVRRLATSTQPLDGGIFSGGKRPNRNLTLAQRDDLLALTTDLLKPCLVCHLESGAFLDDVRASQRTLVRAEFDHHAHIFQRRCLECHETIPISRYVAGDSTVSRETDRSRVYNIPGISNCLECHSNNRASDRCSTCHTMHPNKTMRSNLELFVEKP